MALLELVVAGEVPVRGRADLAEPRAGHHVPEAGFGGEQVDLALPARGPASDPLVQATDRSVEAGDAVAVQSAQQRVMLGEPPGQCLRQVGQYLPAALPADQRIDHRRGGLADNIAGHRVDLDADCSALPSRWMAGCAVTPVGDPAFLSFAVAKVRSRKQFTGLKQY